jgi:hypothetical protein
MTHQSDVFSDFRDVALQRETRETNRQGGFEERIVKQLLRNAGVPLQVGKAKAEALDSRGCSDLDFSWLRDVIPEFPLYMATSKLRNTSGTKIGWTQLFGAGFAKLPFVVEYQKAAASEEWDIHTDRCVLVFNAPGADKSTAMVLHNQPIQENIVEDPERRTHAETRIIRPYGKPQIVYVIESLRSFMETVGTGWAEELCQHHS